MDRRAGSRTSENLDLPCLTCFGFLSLGSEQEAVVKQLHDFACFHFDLLLK